MTLQTQREVRLSTTWRYCLPCTINQVTTYSYGVTLSGSGIASNSLLASVDYPVGGDVDYEYNRQGQRIMLTDQNGVIDEYTDDAD